MREAVPVCQGVVAKAQLQVPSVRQALTKCAAEKKGVCPRTESNDPCVSLACSFHEHLLRCCIHHEGLLLCDLNIFHAEALEEGVGGSV